MLVNCVAYEDGRKIADLNPDEISDYLERPRCFVWVALKDPGPGELAQMQHEFGLHDLAVEDAQHGHQRPKIEQYGDSLFAVLHVLNKDAEGDFSIGEVAIFAGHNYVLSVRSNATQGLGIVRARAEREPLLLRQGPIFVLYALMDAIVDSYFPVLDDLEAQLESIEAQIFKPNEPSKGRAIIEDLYQLKRRLITLQHACVPLMEAVSKLFGAMAPKLCGGMQEYFRDVFDHLQRITKNIDLLREMVTTALSVNLGMISLSENETTKRLGSFAALFAVPTMIAGIYGMNFADIPELKFQYGYPVCVAVMILIDSLLFLKFRKAGWL
ncbi:MULTISPECIES: magnesium/cobalt transporter CorA [Pandoraea]|uniref:Magnesium transport protein CorA n=1 Tax=Pandoraea communis TaxID=2508297 RepID=A0A5E4TGA0_9BURK|nr:MULTISPECIES: magnesium/cobalt transporter CorA [Pandoraea]EON11452.1 magnesium and cobalt transport protein CorA [Pandoraea sp. SD6-2]VVD86282.1 magnesium transporter [Pandoraea communis]